MQGNVSGEAGFCLLLMWNFILLNEVENSQIVRSQCVVAEVAGRVAHEEPLTKADCVNH